MQKESIKIAIVAYSLEVGGLSSVIRNLYKILDNSSTATVELLLLDHCGKVVDVRSYKSFKTEKIRNNFREKFNRYLKFKTYLRNSKFDFIIDQRFRISPFSELIIQKFLYPNKNVIYNIHSSKLSTYIPQNILFCRFLFKNAYRVICCSNAIKDLVEKKYRLKNLQCIYNAIDLASDDSNNFKTFNFRYIVAIGRIETLKQFDKLIVTYSKTNLPKLDIKLLIVGDGSQLKECKTIVSSLNLEDNIVFTGLVSNPKDYLRSALFSVVSSKYEGFPMVILESMACETPVISFDLATGPNEIVISKFNGILVENQNFNALKSAINRMISDKKLLENCKKNTKKSVFKFSTDVIAKEWFDLLNIKEV